MQLTPLILTFIISLSLASPVAEPEPLALANPEALPIAENDPQGNRPNNGMRCRNSFRRVRARSCPGCRDQGWYSEDQWHRMQCYTRWHGYVVISFDDGGGLRAKDWGDENHANK